MSTLMATHAEEALAALAGCFEHWRQTRASVQERIPPA